MGWLISEEQKKRALTQGALFYCQNGLSMDLEIDVRHGCNIRRVRLVYL